MFLVTEGLIDVVNIVITAMVAMVVAFVRC